MLTRRWRTGRQAAVAGAVGMLAVLAQPAGAVTFGTPLGAAPFNVAPSYPYDCSVVVSNTGVFGPVAFPLYSPAGAPNPATSCIWAHVPTPAETAAAGGANISLEPPGTGTVTQVRVRVGAVTGPMQVVVMRALYQNTSTPGRPSDACCFPVARSQTFTPQAGTVTTVPVNLPVKEDATPPPSDITTIADFDTLGLAVLAPNVPVPLYFTGDYSAPADFIWNTSTPSTVTPGFSTDTGGFFVALNADWTAAAGDGGGGGGPALNFAGDAPVRGGNANVTLRCLQNVQCAGQLLLQSARRPGAVPASAGPGATARAKAKTYGTASFKISAGGKKAIKVRLSRAARKLLAKHRTVTVWANVKLTGAGAKAYAMKIKLKR